MHNLSSWFFNLRNKDMAFQKTKIDSELGEKVHQHLLSLDLETPTTSLLAVDNKEKIDKIESHMTSILETIGLDLTDDSLAETAKRIAKMMVLEQAWGLLPENFPKCTTIKNKFPSDEMVKVDTIQVMSICEHHWVTIDGYCTIAYLPDEKVMGLSKFNRIVEYYARRPQVQERLTCQIFEALCFILGTKNVAVTINAKHYCVASRGVGDANSRTTTSKLGGVFKSDPATRAEFYSHANK
jgi:GTP cyclohydrolase I